MMTCPPSDTVYMPQGEPAFKAWLNKHSDRTLDLMPRHVYDPAKYKLVFIGFIDRHLGVCDLHKPVAFSEHFFNKCNGYAIQKSYLDGLEPQFTYSYIYIYEFKQGKCNIYRAPFADWIASDVPLIDEGHGEQVGYPVENMEYISTCNVIARKKPQAKKQEDARLLEVFSRT